MMYTLRPSMGTSMRRFMKWLRRGIFSSGMLVRSTKLQKSMGMKRQKRAVVTSHAVSFSMRPCFPEVRLVMRRTPSAASYHMSTVKRLLNTMCARRLPLHPGHLVSDEFTLL